MDFRLPVVPPPFVGKHAGCRKASGPLTIHSKVLGSGEPVVMIHGLSGSNRVWSRNAAHLAHRFEVHLLDLHGFGRSRGQPFVLSEAAGVVAHWMHQMGLSRAHIVGHSMGGYIATDLAASHPELVERLVLVDAVAVPIERSLLGGAFGLVQALKYAPMEFLPTVLVDAYRAGPRTLVDATLQVMFANLSDRLEQIQAPTLIIWGRHDTLLPLELGLKLHFQLPQADFKIIEGAGHNPMWEKPQAFNQVLLNYLTGGSATRRIPRHPARRLSTP